MLPVDILSLIYQYCDIETIKLAYLTDENSSNIMSSKIFWINKFKLDNLYINHINYQNKTFDEFVEIYHKLKDSRHKANSVHITSIIENEIYRLVTGNNNINEIKIRCPIDTFILMFDTSFEEMECTNKISDEHIIITIKDSNNNDFIYNYKFEDEIISRDLYDFSYRQINNIIFWCLYQNLHFDNYYITNSMYGDPHSEDETVGDIVEETIKVFNTHFANLDQNRSKTVMLINCIEKHLYLNDQYLNVHHYTDNFIRDENIIYIKNNNDKLSIRDITSFDVLSELLSVDISNIIKSRINLINPIFSYLDIEISINENNMFEFYTINLKVHVHSHNRLLYKTWLSIDYESDQINTLLTKFINNDLNIVDKNNGPIYDMGKQYCRRTIIKETLKYLCS